MRDYSVVGLLLVKWPRTSLVKVDLLLTLENDEDALPDSVTKVGR